jgi:MoaA/NifB/PqqE/SkfB family radical SAM enzyme
MKVKLSRYKTKEIGIMSVGGVKVEIKHLDWAISLHCNLKCKMCGYHEPIRGEVELTREEVFRLLREARELGLQSIAFSGGEVLLRRDILAIVAYARELGVEEIIMVTNGTLITATKAEELVAAGVTNVNLSLEGSEPINDYLRGPGTFRQVCAAIGFLQKYEAQLNIAVNIVISKYNYRNLFEFTKFLSETMKIRNISYNPLNTAMMGANLEKYRDQLVVLPEDLPLIAGEVEKIITYGEGISDLQLPFELYLRRIPAYFAGERIRPSRPCLIPSQSCGIDGVGNVFPCWVAYQSAGNIRQEALQAIVAKEIYWQQCERALARKCPGCLVSCYPEVHESGPKGA